VPRLVFNPLTGNFDEVSAAADFIGTFVRITGDTMTGNLVVPRLFVDDVANGVIGQINIKGALVGSQYSNFTLSDNLGGFPSGHEWDFSHRSDHSFLIYNYNGSGFTFVLQGFENGDILFPSGTVTANTILPGGDWTYNLGSGSLYYSDLYVHGVHIDSGSSIATGGTGEMDFSATTLGFFGTSIILGGIPKFSGTNTTGAGSAALGANSPATTNTAPYTWIQVKAADGSTAYIPAWK
jgi:hypothetical protein